MTLCIPHDLRFFSGADGEDLAVAPFWKESSDAGARVAVSDYDHYATPQTPACEVDLDPSMTQVVVVAGGLVDHPPARTS